MTSSGQISVVATVTDAGGTNQERMDLLGTLSAVFAANGQRQPITLTTGFNAITVPTGAQAVVISVRSGAVTLQLKGNTSDIGVALQASTLTTVPLVLPLGTTPTLGITAGGAATLDILWL